MTDVTDADRQKAVRLLLAIPDSTDRVATVAAALAEARAPFLALADEYEKIWHATCTTDPAVVMAAETLRDASKEIRRAADTSTTREEAP